MISRITLESCSPVARIRAGSARPRAAAGIRDCRGRSTPGSVRRRSRSPGRSPGRLRRPPSDSGPGDLVEVAADVLREQQANVAGVAPELAVGEGSFLERSERLHSLVRLPEESQPEHAQRRRRAGPCPRRRRAAWRGPRPARGRQPGRGGCRQGSAAGVSRRRLLSSLRHAGSADKCSDLQL